MEIFILCSILLFTCIFFKYVLFKYRKEPKKFPPGPRSYLPLIGGLFKVGKEPYIPFLDMRKEWGDIFAFDLGPTRVVVLNNHELIKEAFARMEFNGRDASMAYKYKQADFVQNGIIFNTANQVWLDHRRFTMKNLTNLEIGKDMIENVYEIEVKDLIEKFENGKVIITNQIQIALVGILSAIICGKRFDSNDLEVVKLLKAINDDFASAMILHVYPWIFKLYNVLPFCFGFVKKYIDDCKFEQDFAQKKINEHKLEFQDNFQNSLIDKYLHKIKNETNPESNFFGINGGVETTSTTLSWTIHLLALNKIIQEKMYQEIKSTIGLNRAPQLSDKLSLVYTEAVILETLRFSSMAPATVHETMDDIKNFHGYDIPRGTTIFANFYACLHDPKLWENPEEFRPERFLSKDGTKIIKNEAFIPFFTGKRACMGEGLARDVLFIIIASIFQRFEIDFDPELKEKIPKNIEYTMGATRVPVSIPLIFKDRFE